MQVVGRKWQSISDEGRRYFQEKSDKDKLRYPEETRKFHDEVAKIGDQNEEALAMGDKNQASGRKRPADVGTG